MVDRVEFFLTCILITMLFLILCAHVGGPKIREDAGAQPTLGEG